jgi:hypothetical protein
LVDSRLNLENVYSVICHLVQNLSFSMLSEFLRIKTHELVNLPDVLRMKPGSLTLN